MPSQAASPSLPPHPQHDELEEEKTGFWRFDEVEGPRCILSHAFGIETCGSRASSATLELSRRLEATSDGKWACDEQLDKFRGPFSAFVSLWTELAHANKLKDRQCISLKLIKDIDLPGYSPLSHLRQALPCLLKLISRLIS